MTEVRIRTEDMSATEAVPIAEVAFNQVNAVIPTLKFHGVYITGLGELDETGGLSGGFVFDTESGEAFFQVVVHDQESS